MKRWAVGYSHLLNTDLVIEIVIAPTWEDAILNHTTLKDIDPDVIEETLEETKHAFLDHDILIDLVEIS